MSKNTFSQHEESFSGLSISGADYSREKAAATLTDPNSKLAYALHKNISDFLGRFALSVGLQLPMTVAVNLGVAKSAGLSYEQGWKNFESTSSGYKFTQSANMLRHRTYASLIPATVASAIADQYHLPPAALVATNTAIESGIAASVTRESNIRFHSMNAKKYCFTDENGAGVNLGKITREQFGQYSKNTKETEHFGETDWKKLQARLQVYNANRPHQATLLLLRNAVFSSSAFLARPLAQKVVERFGDQIERETGISSERLETVLTYSVRAAFAWTTAILDNAFNLMSAGKRAPEEVYKKIWQDLSHGNVTGSFAGARARTIFCLLASSTIAEGPVLAKWCRENLENFFDPEQKKSALPQAQTSKFTATENDGGFTASGELRSVFGFSSHDEDVIRASSAAAKKSCENFEKILGDAIEQKNPESSCRPVSVAKADQQRDTSIRKK